MLDLPTNSNTNITVLAVPVTDTESVSTDPDRQRRIMLAKSRNYAFMDSRIMLVKSSYYALAPGDIYSLCCTYGTSKCGKLCLFSYLQVASGHKYKKIHVHEYPHTKGKVSMHVRGQHGKEKTILLLFIT